jgi:hypothetical protein
MFTIVSLYKVYSSMYNNKYKIYKHVFLPGMILPFLQKNTKHYIIPITTTNQYVHIFSCYSKKTNMKV